MQAGRPFPPESYYGRFPQWRHELERQFAIHKIDQPDATRVIRILGPDGRREQYQVLKEISQSPNGNLVKARHVRLNRLVVIKTFAGGDQGDAERFQLGARGFGRARWVCFYKLGGFVFANGPVARRNRHRRAVGFREKARSARERIFGCQRACSTAQRSNPNCDRRRKSGDF